ncbi:hypothetical protein E4U61_006561 [Claviceps capensis]|nr:hypothetical protein E4U61_006561 [Claviceps capensis]
MNLNSKLDLNSSGPKHMILLVILRDLMTIITLDNTNNPAYMALDNNNIPAHMAPLDSRTSQDNSKLPALLEIMVLPVTMAFPPMDFLTHIGIPKDPMPADPRTILAALVHPDHKAIPGMMPPLDHMAADIIAPLDRMAVDIMALLDHMVIPEILLPPMALIRNITTATNLTTLKHIKAAPILNMKIEDSNVAKTRSSKRIRKRTNTQAPQGNSSCLRARATPDDWAELLSVMLAGKALTWYMNTLEGNNLTFDDAVMAIHRTFETRSNYQGHFDRFSMMTIQMVMEKHPDKSPKENFDILVTDLETLFYGIYHPSLIDVTLLERLRQAVAGIPEFKQALYTIDATPT